MNLLDLRRQLHVAWVRLKMGKGTHAAFELATTDWDAACRKDIGAAQIAEEQFALEHESRTKVLPHECGLVSCPYGS